MKVVTQPRILGLACIVWLAVPPVCLSSAPGNESSASDFAPANKVLFSIKASDAMSHIEILASDAYQGRRAGSSGAERAARYIAGVFAQAGTEPIHPDSTYYQRFLIAKRRLRSASFKLMFRQQHFSFELSRDFIPLSFTDDCHLSAPVIFAGYGITAPEYGYDDYADIDARGKIVLVLRHEPREYKESSLFRGPLLSPHAHFYKKAVNARAHGAVGMLVVNDPLGQHQASPPAGHWDALGRHQSGGGWELCEQQSLAGFPALWIDEAAAKDLIEKNGFSLQMLQAQIDKHLRPMAQQIICGTANIRLTFDSEALQCRNVIARIPGIDDEFKDEAVVVGAHYDHLGMEDGIVYNGADDNASGTAALLEIAEAFGQLHHRPRRTILFIAFSAEELGLLGSGYYVHHPVIAMKKTVAMLNLDMVGRNHPDEVSIIGSKRSPELNQINILANEIVGLKLNYDGEHYFSRSDQANFARYRVPVLFYNTRGHSDYHRPTDDASKINPEKIARIAQLAFLVAWQIASLDTYPTFQPLMD